MYMYIYVARLKFISQSILKIVQETWVEDRQIDRWVSSVYHSATVFQTHVQMDVQFQILF